MNERDLFRGIGEVSDEKITAAGRRRKKQRMPRWLPLTAAACLVLALGVGAALGRSHRAKTSAQSNVQTAAGDLPLVLAEVSYPEFPAFVALEDYVEKDDGLTQYSAACQTYEEQLALVRGEAPDAAYVAGLESFSIDSIRAILGGDSGENRVYSPYSLYLALAMLSECAGGETKAQILSVLGAEDVLSVRTQTERLWRSSYLDNGAEKILPANSVWLRQGGNYAQSVLDTLKDSYFASSYAGQMGSDALDRAMRDWINRQTDGLLQDAVQDVRTQDNTDLQLLSTLYFHDSWQERFHEAELKEFHMADGKTVPCDFMQCTTELTCLRGNGFTCAAVPFTGGGSMVFVLPDTGIAPEALLTDDVLADVLHLQRAGTTCSVHLTAPKFDVSGSLTLKNQLAALGITDAFDEEAADFTPLTEGKSDGVYVEKVQQAARVMVDEEGCTAAAFTSIGLESACEPEEIRELTLDRPFFFLITGPETLPLYIGIVQNPAG